MGTMWKFYIKKEKKQLLNSLYINPKVLEGKCIGRWSQFILKCFKIRCIKGWVDMIKYRKICTVEIAALKFFKLWYMFEISLSNVVKGDQISSGFW